MADAAVEDVRVPNHHRHAHLALARAEHVVDGDYGGRRARHARFQGRSALSGEGNQLIHDFVPFFYDSFSDLFHFV